MVSQVIPGTTDPHDDGAVRRIRAQLRREVAWLHRKYGRVVVVGHDLGANHALAVLLQDTSIPVEQLYTIGAVSPLAVDGLSWTPVASCRAGRPTMRWINLWSEWDVRAHGAIADHGHDPRDRWPSCYASDDSGVFRTTLQLLNVVGPAVAGALPASLSGPMDYGLELTTVADDPAGPPPDSAVATPTGGTAPIDGDSQPSAVGQGLEDSVRAVGACISMAYVTMASTVASALPTPPRPVPPIVDGPEEAIVFCRASFRDWAHDDENLVEVVGLIAAGVSELITPPNDEATAPSLDSRRRAHVRSHVTSVRLLALFRCLDAVAAGGCATFFATRLVDPESVGGTVATAASAAAMSAVGFALFYGVRIRLWRRWRTRADGQTLWDERKTTSALLHATGFAAWTVVSATVAAVMMYAALALLMSAAAAFACVFWLGVVALGVTACAWGGRRPRVPVAAPRSPAHLTLRPGEPDNGSGGREMLQSAP